MTGGEAEDSPPAVLRYWGDKPNYCYALPIDLQRIEVSTQSHLRRRMNTMFLTTTHYQGKIRPVSAASTETSCPNARKCLAYSSAELPLANTTLKSMFRGLVKSSPSASMRRRASPLASPGKITITPSEELIGGLGFGGGENITAALSAGMLVSVQLFLNCLLIDVNSEARTARRTSGQFFW